MAKHLSTGIGVVALVLLALAGCKEPGDDGEVGETVVPTSGAGPGDISIPSVEVPSRPSSSEIGTCGIAGVECTETPSPSATDSAPSPPEVTVAPTDE